MELDGGEYVHRLGWTPDGSMLTVSTTSGALVTYLTSLPVLGEANGSRMVVLSSLNELSVINVVSRSPVARVQVDLEPAVVGLGPSHVAAGMNNTVYYYRYGPDRPAGAAAVNKRSYLGSVKQVQLNGRHAAILSEGRVLVHPIEGPAPGSPASDEFDLCLPAPSEPGNLACASLTEHFLITGSSAGSLGYYLVAPEGLTVVNETKHAGGGIRRLFPQPGGHRLVCEDDARCAFMYSPVNDLLLPLPQFDGLLESVAWDATDPHTFVAADSAGTAYVYVYVPTSLKGSQLVLVSRQALGPGYVPVSLSNGLLGCRLKTSGSLDHVVLDSHRSLQSADKAFGASKRFAQCLQLHRLKDAWDAAVAMRSGEAWAQLADAALGDLDLDLAVACYRQLGDASMVLSLEALKPVEDKALLAAHVLVLARRDYDGAQELFLRSAQPKAALQMRKDLKHWGEALRLAEQLDPGSVGVISKENAQVGGVGRWGDGRGMVGVEGGCGAAGRQARDRSAFLELRCWRHISASGRRRE